MNSDYSKYEPLFGSWYIEEQIGRGAEGQLFRIRKTDEFGEVFHSVLKAVTIPGDEEAKKAILARGIREEDLDAYYEDTVSRNVKEYRLMYKLRGNSHIVSYEDHQVIRHTDDAGWDILMRMEELTPLTDRSLDQALSVSDVMKMGRDICKGLSFCAGYGIVHRDIKPDNIFLNEGGDYKLGDFGIAQILEYTSTAWSRKGTYTYMAPEVYRGEGYGANVDIYSLGLVMYKYLNKGRDPFLPPYPQIFNTDEEELALAKRISGKPLPPPAEGSEDLKKLVLKACSFRPEDRYASADEMLADIEAVMNGAEPEGLRGFALEYDGPNATEGAAGEARRAGVSGEAPRKGVSRKKRRIAAVVIAAVIVCAGAVWAVIPKEVTAIEGISDKQAIYTGDELAPDYSVEPSRFSDEKITFSSSDGSVFTVDADGRITAVAPGKAELVMSARGYSRTVQITVEPKVTSIDDIPKSVSLETGDTDRLEPSLSPAKFADEKISYSSSDTSVVRVGRKGKLTAAGAGKATVTITAGGCTAKVKVTVTEPEEDAYTEQSGSYGSSGSSGSPGSSGSSGSSNSSGGSGSSGNSDSSGSDDKGYFDSDEEEYFY